MNLPCGSKRDGKTHVTFLRVGICKAPSVPSKASVAIIAKMWAIQKAMIRCIGKNRCLAIE